MSEHWANGIASLYLGDVRDVLGSLPEQSVHACVTSPPYWGLRDYGADGQLGLAPTPEAYIENMVQVFQAVWRVLRDDGTLWLNLGDSYAAGGNGPRDEERWPKQSRNAHGFRTTHSKKQAPLKPKDLVGIPWRVALALQADGWYLRSDIIWSKPNPMPESVTDRPTKAHEYLFLMSKNPRYYYDNEAIREPCAESTIGRIQYGWNGRMEGNLRSEPDPTDEMGDRWAPESGRNKRTVWEIATQPYSEAHFATFPETLVEPCILAGCREGGTVLDPFVGSGTTCVVANRLGRRSVGVDVNEDYLALAIRRISGKPLSMFL